MNQIKVNNKEIFVSEVLLVPLSSFKVLNDWSWPPPYIEMNRFIFNYSTGFQYCIGIHLHCWIYYSKSFGDHENWLSMYGKRAALLLESHQSVLLIKNLTHVIQMNLLIYFNIAFEFTSIGESTGLILNWISFCWWIMNFSIIKLLWISHSSFEALSW